MNISGNRYSVIGNEIWASFMDYVAVIKPHFCKNGVMMWQLIFSKGDGYNQKIISYILRKFGRRF